MLLLVAICIFSACGSGNFRVDANVSPASREDGSGTRDAFSSLFALTHKQDNGMTLDETTLDAIVTNSTSVMMLTTAGDPHGIAYISLGSLNDTVKALRIDGVQPSIAAVQDGTYPVFRPFIIATKSDVDAVTQDFIDYILSAEGQAIVAENGYVPSVTEPASYTGPRPAGKVVVSGSSSVTPVMEKLQEAYKTVNPNAKVELQQSDSSTGMQSAIDGICDIGMASRDLKEAELAALTPITMAYDGIVIIVNHKNPLDNLHKQTVHDIFAGKLTAWSEVQAAEAAANTDGENA